MESNKKALLAAAWKKSAGSALSRMLRLEYQEIGYTEQAGEWTKYGQWYADNIAHDPVFAYGDWCAMFQTWAAYHAGVPGTAWPYISPQGSAVNYMAAWFTANGATQLTVNDMPQPGDVVFYDFDANPDLDHVGMVYQVSGGTPALAQLQVLEGNYNDRVGIRSIAYLDPDIARVYRLNI